jgi:hypothetical protein
MAARRLHPERAEALATRSARATCGHLPRAACHVKDATLLLRRMGDMGKLPTSAWLHLWKGGALQRELAAVVAAHADPRARADAVVDRFSAVYRVGRKLATMFVSALSTPALAPGAHALVPRGRRLRSRGGRHPRRQGRRPAPRAGRGRDP